MGNYRLGVDVGGTFTDLVLFDETNGALYLEKVPSTPANQAIGVEAGVRQLLHKQHVSPDTVTFFIHGTTVATNALLERKGVPCALLVTEGFRDILQIGRQDRPKLYDWFARRPPPLVPRHLRFEVAERLTYTGEVLRALDETQVIGLIEEIRAREIPAIAVCLLHSYANPAHEQRIGALIAAHYPGATVSLSSEILPEFKEYERMSTTVVNAYVRPTVQRYVDNLEDRLKSVGIRSHLHIMQSNGGIMTARFAAQKCVHTILSGPAGGALGAVAIARQAGFANAITVDMGGTSFDICLAYQGQLRYTKESEIGSLPVKVPMLDIHTLGAGGGSIAWIDAGGAVRVGPHSAGSQPGPACYGRGGTEPTVTDANLVLGRIDPAYFLGGGMQLDLESARRAIASHIVAPLQAAGQEFSIEQAAEGIITVVNANMAKGIRVVSVARGFDPREFALVAFGGGGPLHGAELARDLDIPVVLVPPAPGVTSALGLLLADFRHDYSVTHLRLVHHVTPAELNDQFAQLEQQALDQMIQEEVDPDNIHLVRSAEVRYAGQGFELGVPVPGGTLTQDSLATIIEGLHAIHQRSFGYAMRDQEVELVNLSVAAIGKLTPVTLGANQATTSPGNGSGEPQPRTHRRIYLHSAYVEAAIYDRGSLPLGSQITGPAIVEQLDTTTFILPEQTGIVDPYGNLILRKAAG